MISLATLEQLEFPKILALASHFAYSESSRNRILSTVPLHTREEIETHQRLIAEIRTLSARGTPLPFSAFADLTGHISRVRPDGAVLEARELADFIAVLTIAGDISHITRNRIDLPYLKRIGETLTGLPDILAALRKTVDSEGNILDSASPILADLRERARRLEGKIRKKLEELTRDETLSPFLQDHFVTIRSGRWVIPVRMDSKGMIPGVVHDISKSGETAFIEPLGIIHLANELENLVADQKAEELRILRSLCSLLRTKIDEIEHEYESIVFLDSLRSFALLADTFGMENPVIAESNRIRLVRARHPLLQRTLEMSSCPQPIVPLDIELGSEHTVMVITGANAGGKTIAIKTIGLLVLMALSGLPIPADSSSTIPLVTDLLVDIGDEQSIEQNLSTFSAHMTKISHILNQASANAIVLIDELGTGTDPAEGAALACALLAHIQRSGALVFATTHLSDIKVYVHRATGMINASMAFDRHTFTPRYQLVVGEPGLSHAIDIAERYGIPGTVVEQAKTMLGTMNQELDSMISDLREQRTRYERAREDLEEQRTEVEIQSRILEAAIEEARETRKKIIAEAYREASAILEETKRTMNRYLDDMRRKERQEIRATLKKIEASREMMSEQMKVLGFGERVGASIDEIHEGDLIFVRSLGQTAQVTEVKKKQNRLRVSMGSREIEVSADDVSLDTHGASGTALQPSPAREHEEAIPAKLNLVGLRVDEALSRVERYLNDAALSERPEVILVHGIGKGYLAKAIREHLNGHPLVAKYRSGTLEEGGTGVTIVSMK